MTNSTGYEKDEERRGAKEVADPVAETGRTGGGDSGGGAYPNPHSGKKESKDGFMGHGGQTEMPYHGTGQLGEQDIEGEENANSPAKKTAPGHPQDY